MKPELVIILAIIFLSGPLYAQENAGPKDTIRSNIVIKTTPIPFLFETVVSGYLGINHQNLSFTPRPCSEKDRKASSIFPCNDHLINKIDLNFGDIAKIRRRSYLFIIPNRLFIRKSSGETYLFVTSKRKRIIDAYKKYKLVNPAIGLKE